jgi:RNA polymerase sigma factor (sigma-70 family)
MHVQTTEAPEGEDPRDTALLRKLRRARERGDESEEQELIGQLLVGWRGQVEAQQRLWGLSPADAEEVTGAWMERMTKVLMKKAEFDGPFGAVAMENAHWARRDFIRRKERRPVESLREDPSRFKDRSDAADDGFDIDNSPSEALGRALAGLSEREQRILDGFFGQDRAGADVAAELGMSPEAFRVAQHRAIGKIRKRLEAEGVTRSDLQGGKRA